MSTIYHSVHLSKVFTACFVHSRRRFSRNSSAKIPELTTSSCSISRTVRTNVLVEHGDLPLRNAINWSCTSLHTLAVCYILSWPSFTQRWIDSHPIARCFKFLLLPVLRTVFECASLLKFWGATLAVSRWTNWSLRCCCVSSNDALREAPVVRLDSAPIAPGGSVSGAMACYGRHVRKMITKRSGKCWRLYIELQVKMEWVTANLHVQFKLNPAAYSCRGFNQLRDFSKSVRNCVFIYRDTSRWTTAGMSCLIDINRSLFKGKNVCWCLSQDIAEILHESHANYQVIIYCWHDYSQCSDSQNTEFALFE
jgi:hypothetical protein